MFRFLCIIFLILCQIFKYESFSKLKDCTNNGRYHFLFNGLLNAFYKGKQTNKQKRSLLLTKTSFWILTTMIAHDIKAYFYQSSWFLNKHYTMRHSTSNFNVMLTCLSFLFHSNNLIIKWK